MTDIVERAEAVLENRVHILADRRSMALIKELTDEVKRLRGGPCTGARSAWPPVTQVFTPTLRRGSE